MNLAGAPVTRQRAQLLAAAALVAVAVVVVSVGLDLLSGDGLPAWQLAAIVAVLLAAGVGAGAAPAARREAAQVLVAAAAVAALAAVLAAVPGHRSCSSSAGCPRPTSRTCCPARWSPQRSRRSPSDRCAPSLTAATRRTAIGGRRTPESVLEAFGDRAARDVPVEELLRQLAEALRDAYGLAAVEVWTRDGADLVRLLSLPHRAAPLTRLGAPECEALRRSGVAGESWLRLWVPALLEGRGDAQVRVAPAGHGNELLALLLAERPRGAERFRAAEERALGEVVRRLGVVLHNRALDAALQTTLDDLRRTNDELRASRSRLVSAADGERRRIERDIHDGAQQHLAALAINLGLARQLLGDGTVPPDDVPTVAGLLEEMQDDVRETIAQVRDLAHGIYPPLLRQAGLPDALARRRAAQPERRHPRDRRRRRTAGGRRRGGAVLLLPRGAAEHREARARTPRPPCGCWAATVSWCSRSRTTARASTSAATPAARAGRT